MFKALLFIVSVVLLVFSLVAVMDYWDYEERATDIAALIKRQVTTQDIEKQIEVALADDNPADARMYLEIAQRFQYPIASERYTTQIAALETPWQEARRGVSDFASGFVEGSAASTAGVAGAITADFTVVGDVRDLYEQYGRYQAGQPVNELIVALAGVGVGLTAATVVSSGTTAPAKTGSSALKMATRTGSLTPRFQRTLLKQAQDVFDYKAFLLATRGERSLDNVRQAAVKAYHPHALDALTETADQVNTIRQSTSLVDTIDLLRYVETGDDLRRLKTVSQTYGRHTKGLFRLVGKSAIGTFRVLRRSAELMVALVAVLISGLATVMTAGNLIRRS